MNELRHIRMLTKLHLSHDTASILEVRIAAGDGCLLFLKVSFMYLYQSSS